MWCGVVCGVWCVVCGVWCVVCGWVCLIAGYLVHEASKLYDAQLIGKQDPYVVTKYTGGLALGEQVERRTKVHEDGDKYPRWEETFVL